jgi:ribosome-binding protein aMBF1 (putative translation factor)
LNACLSTIFVEIATENSYLSRMSPEQCRAARGWLGWSQAGLAAKANVSLSTVRDFEKGRHAPIAATLAAMQRVLEAAGVEFIDEAEKPVGIRLARDAHGSSA